MGYTQTSNWGVDFPEDKFGELVSFLKESSVGNYHGPDTSDVIDNALRSVELIFGEQGDLYYNNGTISGWTQGKSSWSEEAEVVKWLAANEADGLIDIRGEDDAIWRIRFYEGEVLEFQGQVVFPDDPVKDEE